MKPKRIGRWWWFRLNRISVGKEERGWWCCWWQNTAHRMAERRPKLLFVFISPGSRWGKPPLVRTVTSCWGVMRPCEGYCGSLLLTLLGCLIWSSCIEALLGCFPSGMYSSLRSGSGLLIFWMSSCRSCIRSVFCVVLVGLVCGLNSRVVVSVLGIGYFWVLNWTHQSLAAFTKIFWRALGVEGYFIPITRTLR